MILLDEIIALLSDGKGSLTDALLKTKVLMHKIGHQELAEWVKDELNGYPAGKEVPPYRMLEGRVLGRLQNSAWIQDRQPLPISHLPEKERKYLSTNEMRESVRVLEEFTAKPDRHLMHMIAPELYPRLSDAFRNGWVTNAWIQMEPTQLMNTLIEIRSRLLDFALELRDKMGDTENDADAKQVAQTFDARAMFQHTVFGDNATFLIGDHNATIIKNAVKKNDFNSLATLFKERGMVEEDIAELKTAIDYDTDFIDYQNKRFGECGQLI